MTPEPLTAGRTESYTEQTRKGLSYKRQVTLEECRHLSHKKRRFTDASPSISNVATAGNTKVNPSDTSIHTPTLTIIATAMATSLSNLSIKFITKMTSTTIATTTPTSVPTFTVSASANADNPIVSLEATVQYNGADVPIVSVPTNIITSTESEIPEQIGTEANETSPADEESKKA
jgi:hypothetical protein